MKPVFQISIGIIALTFVLALLLSTPGMISSEGISVIATELQNSSGTDMYVRTKVNFARLESVNDFPQIIGEWHSTTYDSSKSAEALGANITLSRAYNHPNYHNPVFFIIIQSTNISSLHSPIVCYPTLGYEIEEVGMANISIENVSWAKGPWFSEKEGFIFKGELNAKKLVVTKSTDGKINERLVVLYYYLKDEGGIKMILISAFAPSSGSYQDTLEPMKKLASDTFPEMFEVKSKERTIAEILIFEYGALGCALIVMLVGAPIIFMRLPVIKNRPFKKKRP